MRYKEIIEADGLDDQDNDNQDEYLKYSQTKKRAGLFPYYFFEENGEMIPKLFLMTPSDPAFGGTKYQIAKGRVEEGHSFEQTAFKECEEELGCTKDNFILATLNLIATAPFHTYVCEVKNPTSMKEPHYETGSTKWVAEHELKSLARGQQMDLFLKAFEHIDNLK